MITDDVRRVQRKKQNFTCRFVFQVIIYVQSGRITVRGLKNYFSARERLQIKIIKEEI